VVGIAVALVAWLWSNALHNLSVRRISTGFAFLGREAGMPIADAWIATAPRTPNLRAFHRWRRQHASVAVIGIVLATLLGTMIGIARCRPIGCCPGWPRSMSKCSVIFRCSCSFCFWYVLMQGLPAGPRRMDAIEAYTFQIEACAPVDSDRAGKPLGRRRGGNRPDRALRAAPAMVARQLLDGRPRRPLALRARYGRGIGRRWRHGLSACPGPSPCPSCGASILSADLTCRRSTSRCWSRSSPIRRPFIAEIVRSGIQAVHRGQWDAAMALGLRRQLVLQHIVMPQALRVIIPPMTSQFLNLTKNSSLAVASAIRTSCPIANTTLNQTGQHRSHRADMMVFLTIARH